MEPKSRTCLGPEGRRLVLNTLNYFEAEKNNGAPLTSVLGVRQRTSDCLQISLKTIQRIRSLQDTDEIEKTRKCVRDAKKSSDVPEVIKQEVRNVIYDMYQRKIYITLNTLLEEINLRQIWTFKRTSLWRLIKWDLGLRKPIIVWGFVSKVT